MTLKAVGRLALIALTGTFVFAAAPAFAACSGDNCSDSTGKPVVLKKFTKKRIHAAHRRHHDDEVASRDRDRSDTGRGAAKSDTLSSDVADARAQMTADDAKAKPGADKAAAKPAADQPAVAAAPIPAGDAKATAAAAQDDPAVQVVNADELNDVDKAATDANGSLPKLSPAIANSRAEMRDDRPSPWAQTSTIGKAFIAFGVMLTLASAARMFMA